MRTASRIRLVLAGNNAIVLACLERLFALKEDFVVVARCGKGEPIIDTVREVRPDVLLVDLPPDAGANIALLRGMRSADLPTRVIFLAEALTEDELAAATRLGVAGVVPKAVAPDVLEKCIRRVQAGGVWLRPASSRPHEDTQAMRADRRRELTPREQEVMASIGEGLSNKEIAKRLRLGEATVKTHLGRIYEKLRLRDRLQLTLYSRDKRLD